MDASPRIKTRFPSYLISYPFFFLLLNISLQVEQTHNLTLDIKLASAAASWVWDTHPVIDSDRPGRMGTLPLQRKASAVLLLGSRNVFAHGLLARTNFMSIEIFLKHVFYIFMCTYVCLVRLMSTMWMQKPMEVKRRWQITWNWRCLWP